MERDVLVDDLIDHLQLSAGSEFATLSGGLKRRALLGRALAAKPDLLLLDEPTNHLDLDSIIWLEEFLLTEKITLLFVTHDRAFLRRLATRIVELDRGAWWAGPGQPHLPDGFAAPHQLFHKMRTDETGTARYQIEWHNPTPASRISEFTMNANKRAAWERGWVLPHAAGGQTKQIDSGTSWASRFTGG